MRVDEEVDVRNDHGSAGVIFGLQLVEKLVQTLASKSGLQTERMGFHFVGTLCNWIFRRGESDPQKPVEFLLERATALP